MRKITIAHCLCFLSFLLLISAQDVTLGVPKPNTNPLQMRQIANTQCSKWNTTRDWTTTVAVTTTVWTPFTHVNFYMHSEAATNSLIVVVFESKDASSTTWDKFFVYIYTDWVGWKPFSLNLRTDLLRSNSPVGLHRITAVSFNSKWGSVCISNLILTNYAIAPWYTSWVNLKVPSDLPIKVPLLLNSVAAASYDSVLVELNGQTGYTAQVEPSQMTLQPNVRNRVFVTISAIQQTEFPIAISFMQGTTVMGRMHYNVSMAQAKNMQREKPNMLTSYADLQAINQTNPISANNLRMYIAEADSSLKAPLIIPTELGRWGQYYICNNGLPLSRNASDIENYWCASEKKMYTGTQYPNIRGAWVTTQYEKVIDELSTVVTAYGVTLDPKYANFVKPRLIYLASLYPTLPFHNKYGTITDTCGRFTDQSLNEAQMFYKLAYVYDMIYPTLSESERAIIENNMFELVRLPLPSNSSSNWQTFHNAGLAAIGVVMENHELVQYVSLEKGFLYQVQYAMMDDGNWNENSIGYHMYALDAFTMHAEVVYKYGLNLYTQTVPCIVQPESCTKTIELMYAVPVNLALPDASFPALNDGSIGNLKGSWLYEIAHIRYPNNLNYDYVISLTSTRTRTVLAAVAGMRPIVRITNVPATKQSVLMPDLGFGILKSANRADYLGMDFGATGGGHAHADKLNLVLFAANRYIVQDLMTIGYALDIHKDYVKQSQSHNTIMINGKSQQMVDGALEFMSTEVMCGISNAIYPGVSARRTVVSLPGTAPLYMDIAFTYSTAQPPTPIMYPVSWVLHSLGNFSTNSNYSLDTKTSYFNGTSLAMGQALMGSEKAYKYLNNIVYFNATSPSSTSKTYSYTWKYSSSEGLALHSSKLNSMFLADAPSFRNVPDNRMVMEQALMNGNPSISFSPMVHVWNAYRTAQDQDVLAVDTVNTCISSQSMMNLNDPTKVESLSFPCMDGVLRSTTTIKTKSSSSPIILQALYSTTSPFAYRGIAMNYKNQFVQSHGIARRFVRTNNLIVQASQSLVITIANVTALSAQRTTAGISLKQDLSSIKTNRAMTNADIIVGCITSVPTNVTSVLVNNVVVATSQHASSRLNTNEYQATAMLSIPVAQFNANLQFTITCQDGTLLGAARVLSSKKYGTRKPTQASRKKRVARNQKMQRENTMLKRANKKLNKRLARLQKRLRKCKKMKKQRRSKTYWFE